MLREYSSSRRRNRYSTPATKSTATGYGVNWKYIGDKSSAVGCTAIELDVTLNGPAAADGQLGPIVDLIDADGTRNRYRWYGQSLGHHVLTLPLDAPTEVVKLGSSAGLDLAALQHLHLSLDPGQFGKAAPYIQEKHSAEDSPREMKFWH